MAIETGWTCADTTLESTESHDTRGDLIERRRYDGDERVIERWTYDYGCFE